MSELPPLEDLSTDDVAYVRAMLGFAETGSMFQGRYVEAHVARVLGAQLPVVGISTWDLFLPGQHDLRIEVKSTGPGGSFAVGAIKKQVDLWIFVTYEHAMKSRRPHDFRYAVATPSKLTAIAKGRKSITAAELFSKLGVLPNASALQSSVKTYQTDHFH